MLGDTRRIDDVLVTDWGRTGPGVADRRKWRLEWTEDWNLSGLDVREWLARHDWLGYPPEGYGKWTIRPLGDDGSVWSCECAASCD